MQRVHELFDLKREDPECSDLIDRCLVAKYTSLIVHHYHEDKKEPNPAMLRRAMRKYRALLQSLADRVQRTIWKWNSAAATLWAQAQLPARPKQVVSHFTSGSTKPSCFQNSLQTVTEVAKHQRQG